jgi:hypothetical protein
MSLRPAICVSALLVGLAGLAIAAPADAAAQAPAVLQILPGNWSCTSTGPKGVTKSTYAITAVGDLWVQGSASAMSVTYANDYPADPTHEKDVWTYTPTTLSIASTWTEKGKQLSGKGNCTKS